MDWLGDGEVRIKEAGLFLPPGHIRPTTSGVGGVPHIQHSNRSLGRSGSRSPEAGGIFSIPQGVCMNRSRLIFVALAGVMALAAGSPGNEPLRVAPAITKQPVYESKSPKYCLLVFDGEARTRVWLVLDGDRLLVDRNGNGDLSDDGEGVARGKDGLFRVGAISNVDDKTGYRIGSVANAGKGERFRDLYAVYVEIGGRWSQGGTCFFTGTSKGAPVLWFDGPLKMGLVETTKLTRGEPEELYLWVGTPGRSGKAGHGLVMSSHEQGVAKDAHPVAEVEFPGKRPGDPPVKRTFLLKERC
jgi:hypothetical protein